MDGKGRWRDNVLVELLRRTAKEGVYLLAYDTLSQAKMDSARYVGLSNKRQPHSRLDGPTAQGHLWYSEPLRSIL